MFNYVGLFPILTNLIFIAPAVRAFLWGRVFRTFHNILVLFTSGSYHTCKAYYWACLFDFQMHKNLDYVVAVSYLPLDALYLVYFDRSSSYLEWWAIFVSVFVVTLITTGSTTGFVGHAILAGVIVAMLVVYWAVFWYKHGRMPKYDWREFTLGITLSIFGIALFIIQDYNPDGYWYIHSMWHVCVGMGRFFLIGIKKAVPLWMNMASRIEFHMKGGWVKMKDVKDRQATDKLERGCSDKTLERVVEGFKADAQWKTTQSQ